MLALPLKELIQIGTVSANRVRRHPAFRFQIVEKRLKMQRRSGRHNRFRRDFDRGTFSWRHTLKIDTSPNYSLKLNHRDAENAENTT